MTTWKVSTWAMRAAITVPKAVRVKASNAISAKSVSSGAGVVGDRRPHLAHADDGRRRAHSFTMSLSCNVTVLQCHRRADLIHGLARLRSAPEASASRMVRPV